MLRVVVGNPIMREDFLRQRHSVELVGVAEHLLWADRHLGVSSFILIRYYSQADDFSSGLKKKKHVSLCSQLSHKITDVDKN